MDVKSFVAYKANLARTLQCAVNALIGVGSMIENAENLKHERRAVAGNHALGRKRKALALRQFFVAAIG